LPPSYRSITIARRHSKCVACRHRSARAKGDPRPPESESVSPLVTSTSADVDAQLVARHGPKPSRATGMVGIPVAATTCRTAPGHVRLRTASPHALDVKPQSPCPRVRRRPGQASRQPLSSNAGYVPDVVDNLLAVLPCKPRGCKDLVGLVRVSPPHLERDQA